MATHITRRTTNKEPIPFHASETDLLISIFEEFADAEETHCTVIRNKRFVRVPQHDLTEAERRAAYINLYGG